jgi:hypothetical protein
MRAAALGLLAVLAAVPAAAASPAGRDCLSTEIYASTDDTPLGTADVGVRIAGRGDRLTITFENSMPDSGQVVMFGPVPLIADGPGRYRFAFTDNWDAPGRGTLILSGRTAEVAIERTGPAPDIDGQNAGRNYGDWTLTRGRCRH